MKKTYDEIYLKYSNEVYRYLLFLTRNTPISEEITQETFYQAFKSIHSFKGNCSLYTWLCAIAKNCLKTYYTKNAKYVYPEELETILAEQTNYQNMDSLYYALSKLQSPYREIIQLHIFDGYSLKEISKMYNKSESFAKVAYLRAKKMLREELDKNEM